MTPHFNVVSDPKLACSCGCGMLPQRDFMDKIERLRVRCGFPLRVTSAARCAAHNSKVSSTGNTGPHTTGRAIDFGIDGERAYDIVRHAIQMNFTGIGVNQKGTGRFIHVDDIIGPNRPRVWSY